jgi:hypothetical protein
MSRYACFLLGFALSTLSGCGARQDTQPFNKRASRSDTNVVLMLKAVAAVDRAALGFTPILPNTELWLGESGPGYSQMLEVYGTSQGVRRAITFRKTQDRYQWIGEMEMHYGPKTFTTFQGSSQERLVVEYSTEPLGGMRTTNQIRIRYFGDDIRLKRSDLTLADVQPFLQEWGRISIK